MKPIHLYLLYLFILIRMNLFQTANKFGLVGENSNKLVYQSPKYSLKNPNLTIATYMDLSTNISGPQFQAMSALAAVLCTVGGYNSKEGGLVNVNGNFNVLAFDSPAKQASRIATIVNDIVGQNLFYAKNGSNFGNIPDTPIGMIVGIGSITNFISGSLVTGYLPISNLYTQSVISEATPEVGYVPINGLEYYGSSIMSSPSSSDMVFALNVVLQTFNWTLIGILFSADTVGVLGLKAVELLSDEYGTNITMPCFATISSPSEKYAYATEIEGFSQCVSSVRQLRVIVLWMGSEDAVVTAKNITDLTGLHNQLVFISLVAIDPLFNAYALPEMSIFLSPSARQNDFKQSFCDPAAVNELILYATKINVTNINVGPGYCYATDLTPDNCRTDLETFSGSCNCTDSFAFSYVADSINVLMNAIYDMQNNCTYLNECARANDKQFTGDFCALTEFDLNDLTVATRCVNFTGLTGSVAFYNNSIYRQSLPLNIIQVQRNHTFVQIGSIAGFNTKVNTSLAYFYNNQAIISKIVVDDPNITNSALVAVFFALDIALMVVTVAFALFIFIYWKNRVIRKASPLFCLLILLGLLLGELSMLFESLVSSDFLCRIADWSLLIGISLVIGGLLAKNYRIYKIFGNRSAQALEISDLDLVYFTGAVLLITCILFILYQTVDGPLQLMVVQSPDISYYYYTICLVPNSGVQAGFIVAFYVHFALLFFAAAILAFLNRKVDDAYNESGDLGFIACSWIALAIVFAPIFYLQSVGTDSNSTRFAIRYIAVEIAIALTLAVLFTPKILAAIKYESKQRRRSRNS